MLPADNFQQMYRMDTETGVFTIIEGNFQVKANVFDICAAMRPMVERYQKTEK